MIAWIWLTGTLLGLVLSGCFWEALMSDPLPQRGLAILASLFWPVAIAVVAAFFVVASPVWLGMYIRSRLVKRPTNSLEPKS